MCFRFYVVDRIATGGEYHGTAFLSEEKISSIKRSMNALPIVTSTAKTSSMPTYTGVFVMLNFCFQSVVVAAIELRM